MSRRSSTISLSSSTTRIRSPAIPTKLSRRPKRQHDLSEHVARLETSVGLRDAIEWHHAVDDGLQPARPHEVEDRRELVARSQRGPEDRQALEEHEAEIGLELVTRGRAAGDVASAATEASQAP